MDIIELANEFAENLVDFSNSIKELRSATPPISEEQISGYLAQIRTEVLKEAKEMIFPIMEVFEGTSVLSTVKQEQIKLQIENANKNVKSSEEIQQGLNTLLRFAKAADKDLNLVFFEDMFVEIFELLLGLLIKIKSEQQEQANELIQILQNLK